MKSLATAEKHSENIDRLLNKLHERSFNIVCKILLEEKPLPETLEGYRSGQRRTPILYTTLVAPESYSGERVFPRTLRHNEVARDILQARLGKLLSVEPRGSDESIESSARDPDKRAETQKITTEAATRTRTEVTEDLAISSSRRAAKRTKRSQDHGWLLGRLLRKKQ
jgi:hypothetical protein